MDWVAFVMEKGEEAGEAGYRQRTWITIYLQKVYAMSRNWQCKSLMIKPLQGTGRQQSGTHYPTISSMAMNAFSYAVRDLNYVLTKKQKLAYCSKKYSVATNEHSTRMLYNDRVTSKF